MFYDLNAVGVDSDGDVNGDLRACGLKKEMGTPARQFVPGVVQKTEGLPLIHTVFPGNVAETWTLQAMVQTVLKRFPVQCVILVADRGLLSLKNVAELTGMANQDGRSLKFIFAVPARHYPDNRAAIALSAIFAVPARRYVDLVPTF